MQPELTTHDDLLNAFHCFISDGVSGQQEFEYFCQDFGYDEDRRKAHEIWRGCKKSLSKIERLIDEDIDSFYQAISKEVG